jgi:hypothetical protein
MKPTKPVKSFKHKDAKRAHIPMRARKLIDGEAIGLNEGIRLGRV